MPSYICVHGHFYQPPREQPWLEAIQRQPGAYPFHDWNERINTECYRPNAASRVLNETGKIARLVNNYARISFNFGPTLLSWLERADPRTYARLLEGDKESEVRYGGHGSAIAQNYSHMILPLASRRDKITQVRWGIGDFEHRFRRRPEGMWAAEAAVDIETLEVFANEGIRFTVLSPHQAKRVRRVGEGDWQDVSGARVDPCMPYVVRLPSGKSIAVFFYDGPASQAVAFEGLLESGHRFASRLLGLVKDTGRPQLVHIATDGESYGHHHRFGDMALAHALQIIEDSGKATLTNYGQFLELFPPAMEAEVFEPSSWSCAHGVERWRSDCGCVDGGPPHQQDWRGPLRAAFDGLRDELAVLFESEGGKIFRDPWAARDAYIEVILERDRDKVERFLETHMLGSVLPATKQSALRLLEMQRQALLMYTSCGWFFNDIARIEGVQLLRYAGRAVELARSFGHDLEPTLLGRLALAKSHVPGQGDGRTLYEGHVTPSKVSLQAVMAHHAIARTLDEEAEPGRVYCFGVTETEHAVFRNGRARLAIGMGVVESNITWESEKLGYAILHLGDHTLTGAVWPLSAGATVVGAAELKAAFLEADFPTVMRLLDRSSGGALYSIQSLFPDEQERLVERLLEATLEDLDHAYAELYERHAPLIRFLGHRNVTIPKTLLVATRQYFESELSRAVSMEGFDVERANALLEEVHADGIQIDWEGLGHRLSKTVGTMVERLRIDSSNAELLRLLRDVASLAIRPPFAVDLSEVQQLVFELRSESGRPVAPEWTRAIEALAGGLRISVVPETLA